MRIPGFAGTASMAIVVGQQFQWENKIILEFLIFII